MVCIKTRKNADFFIKYLQNTIKKFNKTTRNKQKRTKLLYETKEI